MFAMASSLPVRERGLKFSVCVPIKDLADVAPCAGAWVEIAAFRRLPFQRPVAPCAGAWVEIFSSFPWRPPFFRVAPCAGAWVEMWSVSGRSRQPGVAPCAGAWVEILSARLPFQGMRSLPVRERGLKYHVSRPVKRTTFASLPVRERGLK